MNIQVFWDANAWCHISGDSNLYQYCSDNHKSHNFFWPRAENFNSKDLILNLLGIQRNVDEGTAITIIK
jgi:hypothetical protein